MLTEEEGWDMHGMAAMERVNTRPSVWNEFLNVLRVLNMDVRKEFADHLMELQTDPDRYFIGDLLHVYENNRAMVVILHNLSHPPAQLWNPTVLTISAAPVVTSTMSREAAKHSNRTKQTIRKLIGSTRKTNSVNISKDCFNVITLKYICTMISINLASVSLCDLKCNYTFDRRKQSL